MKTIIATAFVIGLTLISCKKETQTGTPTNVDTIPAMDTMNMNPTPMPADTMNAMPSGDSITKSTDSSTTAPR